MVTAASSLLVLPFAVRSLGIAQFGALATIVSVGSILQIADLGLSNGIVTPLAKALVTDRAAARNLLESTLTALIGLGLSFAAIGLLLGRFTDLPAAIGIDRAAAASDAVKVLIVSSALAIPIGIAVAVQLAAQQSDVAAWWRAAGGVAAACCAALAVRWGAGLEWFVAASLVSPVFVGFIQLCTAFRGPLHDIRPRRLTFNAALVRPMIASGIAFFSLNLVALIAYNADPIIIAHLLGTASVTEYAVPARSFAVLQSVAVIAALPLWSAFADAAARGEHDWIAHTYRRWIAGIAMFTTLAAAILLLATPRISDILAGKDAIHPSFWLISGLAAWSVVGAVANVVSMLLHSLGRLRVQVISASAMLAANLLLSIVWTRQYGTAGTIWATVVAHLVFTTWPMMIVAHRSLRSPPVVAAP
ncbi:MAG: hypothetical protein QOC92_4629 [Acidimicrobiaceae bacterium]